MPKRQSKKIKLLEHHSLSSDSSSSDESAPTEYVPPTSRPQIGPLDSCDLISRVRMFIPLFANAELPAESCDPELVEPKIQIAEELEEEHGVEMDVSLGVFDVAGSTEELTKLGIPVVDVSTSSEPLIREL